MDPTDEHKRFIDTLVKYTPSLSSRLVRDKCIFSKAPDEKPYNEFVRRLSPDDRELLAQMLQNERIGAFHDALVHLHEACVLNGWKITKDNNEIPSEPFGYTMFQEYITVLEDGSWTSMGG